MKVPSDKNFLLGVALAATSSLTFGLAPYFSIILMNNGFPAIEVLAYRWGVGALVLMILAACNLIPVVVGAILQEVIDSVAIFYALGAIIDRKTVAGDPK